MHCELGDYAECEIKHVVIASFCAACFVFATVGVLELRALGGCAVPRIPFVMRRF